MTDILNFDPGSTLKETTSEFNRFFLNNTMESAANYRSAVSQVAVAIISQLAEQSQPFSGKAPAELLGEASAIDFFPAEGMPLAEVIEQTKALVMEHNISVHHPLCLAHLHCPVFMASLVAEMIISSFNQSMDSFDQAPAATMIEQALCNQLCAIYGFGKDSDAIFTSGGTMSNFMGLLLARDHYSQQHFGWNIQENGLPPSASKFRIICSEYAHFSVAQSASILGLGEQAVVRINTGDFSEEAGALQHKIDSLLSEGLLPIAYVTTAGTTDFGSIGNISALGDCAHKNGLWFHVDAAYGGALIFSETHKHKLSGIEKADSVTVDFHKLFYQPISCGVFIVKDKSSFEAIRHHDDYLNPEGNKDYGILDLVYKSIQTTRRFDALKPFMSLQHVGVKKLGEMIDYTIALATAINKAIDGDDSFELAQHGMLNTVLFRYKPSSPAGAANINEINSQIKIDLLLSGKAIIGQTSIGGAVYLKFTLLNPMTEINDIYRLLNLIKDTGRCLDEK